MARSSGAFPGASVVVVSKDEWALSDTLAALHEQIGVAAQAGLAEPEVIVVDASSGRLDALRRAHSWTQWIDFTQPPGVRVSIAHQRNVGVRAARSGIVVFTDAGCIPQPDWLSSLISPLLTGEERITSGLTGATGRFDPHERGRIDKQGQRYLKECPTINLAFAREVFFDLGGFDESFAYGSDIDFSWRAVHRGFRIRYVADAVVLHDWGDRRRQILRSFGSGKGRARLYAKHVLGSGSQSIRKRRFDEHDAVPVAYPLYLIGLPIARRHRSYLLLLAIPLWRNRGERPVAALTDHFVQAVGMLMESAKLVRAAGCSRRIGEHSAVEPSEVAGDDRKGEAGVARCHFPGEPLAQRPVAE